MSFPVPPLRPSLARQTNSPYFCVGEAEGDAAGLVAGLVVAVGLADAAGLAVVDGAAAGSAKPPGDGDGCTTPGLSLTTERGPVTPGREKSKASSIKSAAATAVAFSNGFCAPRGPKAVWLPAPPKAAATSPPLPDCKSTTKIKKV